MAKTYDTLPEALRSRDRVRVLSIRVPRKSAVDVDLTVFPNLESLTLFGQYLKGLPRGLFDCHQLRELDLCLPLASLPKALGRLEKLESLSIHSAGLTRLPDELGQLKRLKYLNLEFNRLRSLPNVFDQLPQLETLVCFENRKLSTLPPSLLRARALKWVELGTCELERTPLLEKLSAEVPVFFCRFPDLSHERKPKRPTHLRSATLPSLLESLRALNTQSGSTQRVHPPGRLPQRIPTLAAGRPQRVTPMLKERFAFAGRWVGAHLGQTWLAAEDMEPLAPALRRQIALRRENWTDSPVAKTPQDRLTLFGADRRDGEETYLVWTPGKAEPQIVEFFGASEKRYRDLRQFLEAIIR